MPAGNNKRVSASAAPSSGNTITIPPFDDQMFVMFVNPPGLLAVLNIVLPDASDGQIVRVISTKTLTLLGITSTVGTVVGALTTLLANASFAYVWSEDLQSWYKIT